MSWATTKTTFTTAQMICVTAKVIGVTAKQSIAQARTPRAVAKVISARAKTTSASAKIDFAFARISFAQAGKHLSGHGRQSFKQRPSRFEGDLVRLAIWLVGLVGLVLCLRQEASMPTKRAAIAGRLK